MIIIYPLFLNKLNNKILICLLIKPYCKKLKFYFILYKSQINFLNFFVGMD